MLPRYPAVSRNALCFALLGLHLRLPHSDDISRCWTPIMSGSPRLRARAAGIISGFPLDAVYRLWGEDLLISGASPPVWDLFGAALARGGAYADAVYAIAERLTADAGLRAADPAENSVNALEHFSLPEASVRRVLKYLGPAQTCHRPFLFHVASSALEPVRS